MFRHDRNRLDHKQVAEMPCTSTKHHASWVRRAAWVLITAQTTQDLSLAAKPMTDQRGLSSGRPALSSVYSAVVLCL